MKKCLWMSELEQLIKRPLRTKKLVELEYEKEMARLKNDKISHDNLPV